MRRAALLLVLTACSPSASEDAGRDATPIDAAPIDAAPTCAPFETSAPIPSTLPACSPTLPMAPTGATIEAREMGVVVHRNLPIAMRGGYSLEADLWLPAATAGTPPGLLIIVHGGGWLDCANRRDTMSLYAEFVAQLGIAALNVEYRLAQEGGGYPENVSDVICAVQWAHDHVGDHGLSDRIGMVGTSAGGHLALMAALVGDRPDLDPGCGSDASLDVLLSYAGPTDLPSFVDGPSEARQAPPLYTDEACDIPVTGCLGEARGCTRCVDASPLAHACTARLPIVLLQAPDPYDRLVPEAQARSLFAALDAAGADVTLVIPSDAEMRANGCTPEGGSHALDGCMLRAGGPIVNPLLATHLGRR